MMATMTVLLGLSVGLFLMLFRLNDSGQRHVENEAAIARVARVFRRDVRGASSIGRCDAGGVSERISLSGSDARRLVEYLVTRDGLTRVEWDGEVVVEQERFRLPSRPSTRFERAGANEMPVVALTFDRSANPARGDGESRRFAIKAILGASRRFESRREVSR